MSIYELSFLKLEWLKLRNKTCCQTCNKELKVGDLIFTKHASRENSTLRHESCARRVGLID